MSAPPLSEYTLESVVSELEGCSIDQHSTTSEEATSPATRWLPSAPAAEEPEDSSYDMSVLQDALDDCGKMPQTNEYVHLGYYPEPRIVYRDPAIDYSSCPYAPPPLEIGKVKKVRKYKVCSIASPLVTSTDRQFDRRPVRLTVTSRRCAGSGDTALSRSGVKARVIFQKSPEVVAALSYIFLRHAR